MTRPEHFDAGVYGIANRFVDELLARLNRPVVPSVRAGLTHRFAMAIAQACEQEAADLEAELETVIAEIKAALGVATAPMTQADWQREFDGRGRRIPPADATVTRAGDSVLMSGSRMCVHGETPLGSWCRACNVFRR